MNALKIKKGDTVMVIAGKDKGKKGKILRTVPTTGKVIVEGVNIATLHKKPRTAEQPGGILKQEAAIYACKVMVVCPKCHKPVRFKTEIAEKGEKSRICKACGAAI